MATKKATTKKAAEAVTFETYAVYRGNLKGGVLTREEPNEAGECDTIKVTAGDSVKLKDGDCEIWGMATYEGETIEDAMRKAQSAYFAPVSMVAQQVVPKPVE